MRVTLDDSEAASLVLLLRYVISRSGMDTACGLAHPMRLVGAAQMRAICDKIEAKKAPSRKGK